MSEKLSLIVAGVLSNDKHGPRLSCRPIRLLHCTRVLAALAEALAVVLKADAAVEAEAAAAVDSNMSTPGST